MTSRFLSPLFALLLIRVGQIASNENDNDDGSIYKLSSSLIDCTATVEDVDGFNNRKLFPLLTQLLEQNYFRYYKVNMEKACPLWREERECTNRECGVQSCDEDVPAGLRIPQRSLVNGLPSTGLDGDVINDGKCGTASTTEGDGSVNNVNTGNKLDPLDKHISNWQQEQFVKWAVHDDSLDNRYCDVDDEDSDLMHYVDLQRNPERYTGYKGDSAIRVWKAIYEENCFKPDPKFDKQFLVHPSLTGLCLEKRVFYRLISGLHTSITVSIAAHNYEPPKHSFGEGRWVRNVRMFKNRFFNPKDEKKEGVERLKNLYFVYLLELKAVQKLAPYLKREYYYTGVQKDDQETRRLVDQLSQTIDSFPRHFDESVMFRDVEAISRTLKEEFRRHFLNISRIMDCVGCDKCRLWGKLQTHGIGTALKILFSNQLDNLERERKRALETNDWKKLDLDFYKRFQLQRNDLVALLNSLGRFASSITQVEELLRLANDQSSSSTKVEL